MKAILAHLPSGRRLHSGGVQPLLSVDEVHDGVAPVTTISLPHPCVVDACIPETFILVKILPAELRS